MSNITTGPYDMDSRPSAQEAVKRLSSGFSLSENAHHVMTPKDDKSLKIATFSLQGYLKVCFRVKRRSHSVTSKTDLLSTLGKRLCNRISRKRWTGLFM